MLIHIILNLLNQELLVGDGIRCFHVFGRDETYFVRVRIMFGIRSVQFSDSVETPSGTNDSEVCIGKRIIGYAGLSSRGIGGFGLACGTFGRRALCMRLSGTHGFHPGETA